ncbi:MAG: (2Fe-2S)-binding protein [Acidobacteria bacterium]|nr:(2Fe-2S)-binding protein [Acidobacteriota bacterium]
MPIIRFVPLGLEAPARDGETILDVARRAGAPIGNSCGGVGWCARCRICVIEGAANLSAATWVEQEKGDELGFTAGDRLACQACIKGDLVVTTTYWGPIR